MTGSPYLELAKHTYIVSSTGFVAKIDYSGRGWLSGKKNSFIATLSRVNDQKNVLYKVEGQWTEGFVIKDAKGKEAASYDPKKQPAVMPNVRAIDEQGDLESRKAWRKVAEAIKSGDMDAVQREKSLIENSQRELRKKEKEEGKEWERKFFKRVENDEEVKKLEEVVNTTPTERTKKEQVWEFTGDKGEGHF